jgi:hypothetical protein
MAKQLLKTTDVWLTESEEEAISMVEDAKNNQSTGGYTMTKGGYTAKPKKSKGEVLYIEYKVTIEKTFD